LTAEAPVARENREPSLSIISEKQYQLPAGLARNCRFFFVSFGVACWFVYPRSTQVVIAGLDPAIHENTVISNLSD
jgi:hypothetical protein